MLLRGHEHFYKTQMEMNIANVNYCDCVIWSPRKSIVVRVYADTNFWRVALEKATTFHERVVMPELLAKYYTSVAG